MLRMHTVSDERWCDKTMSVLKEQQREACQERLSQWPQKSVFASLCDDEYQDIFSRSYDAQENRLAPSREALCERLLARAPIEAMYLSPAEDALCKRMLISPDHAATCCWEDISAAEALVKRLWCVLKINDDDAVISLVDEIRDPIMEGMLSEAYPSARDALFAFDATLHGLLYLSGFLYAEVPKKHFAAEHMSALGDLADSVITRYLRAGFDYTQSVGGEILLVHPGLAEPERLFRSLNGIQVPESHLTREMMLGGMNGILPEEVASAEAMRGALCGAVRPECDEDETLEDLRMMAKQGASCAEMREVLESTLCVLPTPRMLASLKQLHMQAVRWIGVPSAVLN